MRRTITYASWAAIALVVLYVAAALFPLWRTTSGHHGATRRPTRPVGVATTSKLEDAARPAATLPAARATAVAYATDAFSTVAGKPSDAWIEEVASISTSAWRRHLAAAESATTTAGATVVPSVVATYPSWAPKGFAGVTVVLRRGGAVESLYLELRVERGRYLVEATQ